MRTALALVDRGLVPDPAIRFGIRRLLRSRLREERRRTTEDLAVELGSGPIAVATDAANAQHYELPTEFFSTVLGPRMKYSSALWPEGVEDLAAAEERMLELTAERALLEDGNRVLELGCGWGSLTLWALERWPDIRWTAVTNSRTQAAHLLAEAERLGVAERLRVVRSDVNDLDPGETFDRLVSVEMFEHVRNYRRLFTRIGRWLEPGGRLFVHIFCHRHLAYRFETRDDGDWMARHFFTGGTMPSFDLLPRFQQPLTLEERWWIPGLHYARTAEAWLANHDRERERLQPLFRATYDEPEVWWERWRVFFLSCAELFAYGGGSEWGVGHYRWTLDP